MSGERFTTKNGVFYIDNETGWEFECYGEIVKLMNELHEENEDLKRRMKLVSDYFIGYLDELREDMDYEQIGEMYEIINNLKIIH